jgi:hypothetical protein
MVFANDDRVRMGVVPRIFFASAPEDAPRAAALAAFLGPFPLPISVTADAVVPGERWNNRLAGAADQATATHVYAFWSEHAERASEVAAAADRAIGAGQILIPVRLDATPLPRHLAVSKCIDARFVAGVNGEQYDGGFSNDCVVRGKALLTRLGVPISQILGESPWPRTPQWRADGYAETDPRLLAIAFYAALR